MDRMKTMARMPDNIPRMTKAGNSQNDAMIPVSKVKAGKSPNQAREMAVPATLEITIGANAFKA